MRSNLEWDLNGFTGNVNLAFGGHLANDYFVIGRSQRSYALWMAPRKKTLHISSTSSYFTRASEHKVDAGGVHFW